MNDLRKIDRADALEVLWPLHGPYAADSIVTASIAIEHLWRYLAHMMLRNESRRMDSTTAMSAALRNLANSNNSASQVLTQFNRWAERVNEQPEFAHDEDLPHHLVHGVVGVMASAVSSAASQYEAAAQQLLKAAAILGHLYLDCGAEGGCPS
ncbi:hypothetical protein [Nocardia tengchongensis]